MTFKMQAIFLHPNNLCVSGQVSGLVSAAEGDIPGSRGCGRGTERVEDTPGTGEFNSYINIPLKTFDY